MGTVQLFAPPELALRAHAEVGEGPVFDQRTGRLCWVDIVGGMLFESDLTTGAQVSTAVGMMLGAAAPRASVTGFAVAVADGFGLLVNGKLDVLDAVLPEPYRRMNDAKCDSSGRLWAGSTHMEYEPGFGSLHCWSGDGPSRLARSGFTLPNGLGWSPDDSVMYLADSMARQILSAPFDREDGTLGEFSEFCPVEGGLPDGLAVDMDGCIWIAIWGASEVRRYSPSGELVGKVPTPVAQPSSCAFGVDGTLYITSAATGFSGPELERQPLAGSIFALSTATRGVPVHPFAR